VARQSTAASGAVPATWDAIVIGSGMGAMTAAVLLARRKGWRILMLEQHFTLGGQTHEFRRRGKFEFDIGLHYLGRLEPGTQGRAVFDYLTGGGLDWQRMPEDFERFVYPGLDFRVPSHPARYRELLQERFPEEAGAIGGYFKDLGTAAQGFILGHLGDAVPRWLRPLYRGFARRRTALAGQTTREYMARRFRDPRLRALLTSQWGDYGLPPRESLFGVHATVAHYYLRGGWYPVGGAKAIAQAMLPAITRAGGRTLNGRRVKEIIVEDGRAVGVRVGRTYRPRHPEEAYRAPVIISDAGALNTYLRLLPPGTPLPFRDQLESIAPGVSAIVLYLGLRESPARLGVRGENFWIFESLDHDALMQSTEIGAGMYISFASLKNPRAKAHTAQIITFASGAAFERWRGQPWKQREDGYYKLKEEIAGTLIQKADAHIPGLAGLIEFQELATPLTLEHFLDNPGGSFYGVPCRPGRLFAPYTHARSPVPGLYLTGQDVMSPGVAGAMMGGIKCAGALLGPFGFFRLMGHILRSEARRARG
jgi:phytoene dehydrogenase-like protein